MKQSFIFLFTLISFISFAQDSTFNDANAEKRTLSGSFNAIEVSTGIDLYLTQGNEEAIAVSASDPKYMEHYKTEVVDGTLKIYYEGTSVTWVGSEKRKLKAYVSFKTLEKLHASSGASVLPQGTLSIDKLDANFSSGASFKGAVNINQLYVSQSSGSSVDITGKSNELKIDVSSGAIFKGYDLTTDFCDAKASSGGGVRISVNKELSAKASSGGGIHYKGAAVIKDLNVSSGGSVKKA